MYWIVVLTILSTIHAAASSHQDDAPDIHLVDQQGRTYQHGSADICSRSVQQALSRLGTTTLTHGGCAVVFHGVMGVGKSSIIERLTNQAHETLSSGNNERPGGHTQQPDSFVIRSSGSTNTCHLIDTVGFGETSLTGQVNVDSGLAKVQEKILDLQVPVFRLYLVLDPEHTQISSELHILKQAFGANIAKRTRLIVNKSDLLADKGPEYIHKHLIPGLQSDFRQAFDADPDKILFVCARYYSDVACLGQLTDDLCDYQEGDFINIDRSSIQQIQDQVKQNQDLIEALQESPSIAQGQPQQTSRKLIAHKHELGKRKDQVKAKLEKSRQNLVRTQDLLQIQVALKQFPDTESLCCKFQDRHNVNVGIFFVTHQLLQSDHAELFRRLLQSESGVSWNMEIDHLIKFWNKLHRDLAKLDDNAIQALKDDIAQHELTVKELDQQIWKNELDLCVLERRQRHP